MTVFATSIACASRENQLNNMANYPSFVSQGAFAAASVFGFFACIVYIAIIVFSCLDFLKARRTAGLSDTPQPSQTSTNAGSTSPTSKPKKNIEEAYNI
jgi:predicted lipid-binding transport protein (Tim44 family)